MIKFNVKSEGLTCPALCAKCGHLNPTYVQGVNGPERRDVDHDGEHEDALWLVRIKAFKESYHKPMANAEEVFIFEEGDNSQLAVELLDQFIKALSDGEFSTSEGIEMVQTAISHGDFNKKALKFITSFIKK